MKVAILIAVACLFASAQAQDATNFLEQLKNALKNTVDHVKDNGKQILTGLAGQLTQTGSQLLQSTLLKLLEGLGTQAPGKRDLAKLQKVREMFAKFQASIKEKKEKAGGVVSAALSRLQEVMKKLGNLSFLKKPLAETTKEVDDATDHYVEVHTRFIEGLTDQLKNLGQGLVDQLTNNAAALAQQLLQQALTGQLGKRELNPAIQGLVDFFKPHVKTVVDTASQLGNTLKGHATNLWNTVQSHAGQLTTKLQGHVDELKKHGQTLLGHGQNAVDALKAAVTDILKQTMENSKTTITDAGKTLGNAAGVISGHLTDALKNAGSQ
jgi:predicted PurR-regulated permease PerM